MILLANWGRGKLFSSKTLIVNSRQQLFEADDKTIFLWLFSGVWFSWLGLVLTVAGHLVVGTVDFKLNATPGIKCIMSINVLRTESITMFFYLLFDYCFKKYTFKN